MRTVITHFYNEAYMLPWWLAHHAPLFDHGVLINHGSTDESVAICKAMVPHWAVVDTFNPSFDALMVDFEVMHHERLHPGWKIALNVSEFLHCADLPALERDVAKAGFQGVRLHGVVMVDVEPERAPDPALPLFAQKHHGFLERQFDHARVGLPWYTKAMRNRLYHCATIGAYSVGRHQTQLPLVGEIQDGAYVLWYGFAPWNERFIQRKLAFAPKVSATDRQVGFGWQHLIGAEQMAQQHREMRPHAKDLRTVMR
jgi:hypothetical protein